MKNTEWLLPAIAIIAVVTMVCWWVSSAEKVSCTRAGIQAGWATEAIKELCK